MLSTIIITLKLRNPYKICAAILVLFALPVILYSAYSFNHHNQITKIEKGAADISRDIGERIGETRTLMASLVGLNNVSPNLNSNELQLFSQEVLRKSDYITTLGRFERVRSDKRSSFESEMIDTGLFNFRITQIDGQGRVQQRSESAWYYPISMLEPMKPDNTRLVGADLASVRGLSKKLDEIISNNSSVIAKLPDSWPSNGDLVAFRAVYLGKETPKTDIDRFAQSAGGFWASIDVRKLLSSVNDQIEHFDLTIEIESTEERSLLYGQMGEPDYPVYLKFLHHRKEVVTKWKTGADTSLVVTFKQDIGFSIEALIEIALGIIILIVIALLYTSHVVNKRQSSIERSMARDTLFQEREKAEKTLNAVQDSIITLDADLRVVHINPAAIIQFNLKSSQAIGDHLSNIVQLQEVDSDFELFNVPAALANLQYNSKREFDVVPAGRSHDDFVLRLTLTTSRTHEGRLSGHVLVLRDISHERRLTNKLAYQANHDSLTGCTNRYYFEKKLATLIDELPYNNQSHALCYMDLDQFKVVNDTCGHRAGDRLLRELTENMKTGIRDGDVLSRLGGDEFGLLVVDATPEAAVKVSEQIYNFFQNYVFHHEEKAFAVRASIGLVHIDQSCGQLKDVMAAADIACYAAKDSGRNSLSIYSKTDENMTERSEELSWLPRLQTALQNNEFRLHVQAVASLDPATSNAAVTHFEFLLRLANPNGSVSTPWQFIQAAERYDLMREIDKWVIRNALRTVAELKGSPGGDCSFSINLSGQSAADPTLRLFIQNQLEFYKVDPAQIWFELTETAAISHFSIAIDLINFIRSFGSKVALDDFGSGLSSFGYLKNLPVDIIKIDGQFVREIAKNPIDREMVRAIHQVGKSMGIETVAEFVEDQDIVDELIKIGIDYAQGYHIGKPCPVGEAMALLSNVDKAA